jgi:uncharacterized membrane protein
MGARARSAGIALLWSAGVATAAEALPFFTGIGDLPGGSVESNAFGISGDGTTVVGNSFTSTQLLGVRWVGGTLSSLGAGQEATDASYDGSVIVGLGSGFGGRRWENGSSSILLGPDGAAVFSTEAVSADGSVVVGRSSTGALYRWENGISVALGLPAGWTGLAPGPIAVSGDGSTVTFTASVGLDTRMAFMWQGGVFTPLGAQGPAMDSDADAISADGTVIVGRSAGAFRWEGGVMQSIPISTAVDVAADGSVIVGNIGGQAVVWYAGGVISLLYDQFNTAGLNVTGWTLDGVWAVSDDGLTFAGTGINPSGNREGWVGHLDVLVPEPSAVLLLAVGAAAVGLGARRSRG